MTGYTFDPAGFGWLLLGALLTLALVMGGSIVALWRLFGAHLVWALSVASQRAIDGKLGTSKPTLLPEVTSGS